MNALIFGNGGYESLCATLLSQAPLEAAAVLLAGTGGSPNGTRLLIRETIPVPTTGYLAQEEFHLRISAAFLAPLLKRSRLEGWSIVVAHSHPFGGKVRFSAVDDAGERQLIPSIVARAPDRPHGAVVVGLAGFDARIWFSLDGPEVVEKIADVGPHVRWYDRCPDEAAGGYPPHRPDALYDRSVRALGESGQRLLSSARIGIVGVGGIGSIIAEQLAHLGVKELVLLDPDVIDHTNLNRVVGSNRTNIGRAKVSVTAEMVSRIRGEILVTALQGSVLARRDAQALLDLDLIFACTDSHGSRAVLNQMAYQYLIPVIDTGVRIDAPDAQVRSIAGRVQMLSPGLPCLACQTLLDPEEVRRDLLSDEERVRDPYIVGAPEPQPAVISFNGTVASLAVTMLIAAITGLPLSARHQVYLAERGIVRAIQSSPLDGCIVCSLSGALARGDLWPLPWRLS